MFRRALSLLILTAMLAAALMPAALAISAGEALFGDSDIAAGDADYDDAMETYGDDDEPDEDMDDEDMDEAGADAVDDEDDGYDSAYDASAAGRYPTLRLGDRDGEDSAANIVFLQNRLNELGYLRDPADGAFGEGTESAVRMFQRNNGLPETGVADSETQALLFSDSASLVAATRRTNVFGSDVTRVQTMLAQWGFYGGAVDGEMGSGTQRAIRDFRAYMREIDPEFAATPTPAPTETPNVNGMFDDMPLVMDQPLAGSEAAEALDSRIDDKLLEYVDGAHDFVIYHQDVRQGDSGREVLRVQTRLRQLRYLYNADGQFGATSELALKYFQRKHGLKQTGVADAKTQQVLFSGKAKEAEEYVFPYKIVVDISDQRVYVGKWTGKAYTKLVKKFKCSTGKDNTPTPTGTYQALGRGSGDWYYFKDYNCYAKWGYVIVGGILFHSVTFNSAKQLNKSSVRNLGHKASHGCVRLSIKNAKWIYDHCPSGTTVVIRK